MLRRCLLFFVVISGVAFGQSGKISMAAGDKAMPGPSSGAQSPAQIDFLAGTHDDPFAMTVADIYSTGNVQPLGTRNDGFGILTPLIPPGLQTLLTPQFLPHTRTLHTGRLNRDTRVADFDNDGFLDVVSNTYDCVDPLNPDDVARLYRNNGDGTFTEVSNPFHDASGNPVVIRGRGETIVVADFNNDGYLDIFIPFYTYTTPVDPDLFDDPSGHTGACLNSPQSYLLINDGTGHFTEVADAAGVSLRNDPAPTRVEGAQALDFNNDGLIDLFGGSHVFINTGVTNGVPHFVDQGAALGLPRFFDEGAKFIDADNSGTLSLVLLDSERGPSLFRFDGSTFALDPNAFPSNLTYSGAFGLNAYDINNDGLDDVVIVGGDICDPKIFLGTSSGFTQASPLARGFTLDKSGDPLKQLCSGNGAMAFGDINNDGRIDVLYSARGKMQVAHFLNNTQVGNSPFLVEVLGPNGEHNQQGRVVRVSPQSRPDVIMTRIVDGGSGYLSQNQYSLLIGSRFAEPHVVTLSLPVTAPPFNIVDISFTISSGQKALVYAPSAVNPSGLVKIGPSKPFVFDPALLPELQGTWE